MCVHLKCCRIHPWHAPKRVLWWYAVMRQRTLNKSKRFTNIQEDTKYQQEPSKLKRRHKKFIAGFVRFIVQYIPWLRQPPRWWTALCAQACVLAYTGCAERSQLQHTKKQKRIKQSKDPTGADKKQVTVKRRNAQLQIKLELLCLSMWCSLRAASENNLYLLKMLSVTHVLYNVGCDGYDRSTTN